MTASCHKPVLLAAVLEALDIQPGAVVVDGTLGGGGYTRAFAKRVGPDGTVVALDLDTDAILRAERELAGLPVFLCQSNYTDLPEVLKEIGITAVDAIALDLGLSSDQLADDHQGFSFQSEGELDLRFDTSTGEPAWRLLERLDERTIADVIYRYGEERFSRRIARAIVAARRQDPPRTAAALARIIHGVMPRRASRIDPATKTFQALRIAVNDELASLETALKRFPTVLKPGGRLAVVSFHSLEDRLAKSAFRDDDRWLPLGRKPITPSDGELAVNPRARSAKLRVAVRA